MPILTGAGIFVCLVQSALFSGLTLGLFGLSRLRLEIAAAERNRSAIKILTVRKDANFLLATLLWGNVSVNVLLTMLTDSALTGLGAFLFSTVGITVFGEIMPQAYFSRHAARVGVALIPFIRFYGFLLYPVAKPSAFLLDAWLGKEGVQFFREKELEVLLEKHMRSGQTDIGRVEGLGAVNFLALDDIRIQEEGEVIDPRSIVCLPVSETSGLPIFPNYRADAKDLFLRQVNESGKKWVILTCPQGEPILVLNVNLFLRDVFLGKTVSSPYVYCHRPLIVTREDATLGQVITDLKVYPSHSEDDVIVHDLILYWGAQKRIITGADILGRLLRGISTQSLSSERISPTEEEVKESAVAGKLDFFFHLFKKGKSK